jgi:hypothetical protein
MSSLKSIASRVSDLFAFADLGGDVNVLADGEPGLARTQMASGSIFATLGVRPVAGRLFSETDPEPSLQRARAWVWARRWSSHRSPSRSFSCSEPVFSCALW